MSELARGMARIVWWWMLRFMRLPAVRQMRRWWMSRIPESTARRMIRQDQLARRYGRRVLAFSITLLLASIALTGCYFLALAFVNSSFVQARR